MVSKTLTIQFCPILQGVATALPLAFILPSACYMKLETGHMTGKRKVYALLLLIFGCSVAFIGTMKIVANIFFGHTTDNCSHGHELDYCPKNQTAITEPPKTFASLG